MAIQAFPVNRTFARIHKTVERHFNTVVRGVDNVLGRAGLGGRKGPYDDVNYTFEGGERSALRKKHYDKSLRLLWKAEMNAPFLDFRDATKDEKLLAQLAEKELSPEERRERKRMSSAEFRRVIEENYTPRQRQALVNILSAIGHGEAYAWMVSNELLSEVRGTGGRAALTMQVLEEAKHFVVMRELLRAFDLEIPRLSGWEYLLLEQILKSKGLEKFFGMNVVVEGIALSIFGLFASYPGMEILRLFHLDESRHTALPINYLKEFPLSSWQQHSPFKRLYRFHMVAPIIPFLFFMEEDLAELGLDPFEFGGSIIRKLLHLAERAGFHLPMPSKFYLQLFDGIFNLYCYITRENHSYRHFSTSETTLGAQERAVEDEVFAAA